MSERILSGELDVSIEGEQIEYETPFTKWCSHHLYTDAPNVARAFYAGLDGCSVVVLFFPPHKVIGKDQNGNDMLEPQKPQSVGGRVTWKTIGE